MEGGGMKETMKFLHDQTPMGRMLLFLDGPRKHPTYRFENFLEQQKAKKVTSLHVGRKPIHSKVDRALDLISWGGFSKAKKKLGYDAAYHQYILAGLDDGTFHKIERNEIIEHKKATNEDFAHDYLLDVPVEGKDLSLDTMIKNAALGNPNFYVYRGRDNNCQYFTRDIIEKNDLMPKGSPELVPQDSNTLLDSIPEPLRWIPNAVTDFAGAADRATSMVANGLSFLEKKDYTEGSLRANKKANKKRNYKTTVRNN